MLKIKGKPKKISFQEFRALLYAVKNILEYHNKYLTSNITIVLKNLKGKDYAGGAYKLKQKIIVSNNHNFTDTATILIHEFLHLYMPNDCQEKVISTLTARLKEDVIKLANILVNGTQKRAAYFAHAKISYQPLVFDYYDKDQWHKDHEKSLGKKYRKNVLTKKESQND